MQAPEPPGWGGILNGFARHRSYEGAIINTEVRIRVNPETLSCRKCDSRYLP